MAGEGRDHARRAVEQAQQPHTALAACQRLMRDDDHPAITSRRERGFEPGRLFGVHEPARAAFATDQIEHDHPQPSPDVEAVVQELT